MHEKCTCIGCRIHQCLAKYQQRFLGLGRRILFVAWFLVCLEGSAWVALSLWRGEWTTPVAIQREKEEIRTRSQRSPYALLRTPVATPGGRPPDGMELEVLHPYLGYVRKPTVEIGSGAYYGFEEAPDTWVETQKNDTVVIGIFGGSVAQGFYYGGAEELVKQLRRDPSFRGKKIVTKLLALAGYKQPQQLFALNYYLSLGGHLDIAVNIDGVNELFLPSYENIPKGVFPFYPRSWFFRIQPEESADLFPIIGQISYLTQKRSEWTHWFASFPLHYSMTAGTLWKIGDAYLARKIGRRETLLLARHTENTEEYIVTGPRRTYQSDEEALVDIVDYWQRASLLMHRESTANSVQYFHFLQPNGRLEGAKPLAADERAKVFRGPVPPTNLVNAGYPLLREAGGALRRSGVRFTDLSRVFHDVRRPLYVDCCHVESEGSRIMARAIADAILRDFHGLKR